MNSLNNLKIKTKLLGGFILVALFLVVMAIMNYSSMSNLNAGTKSLYENRTVPISQLGKINANLWEIRGDLNRMIISADVRTERALNIQKKMESVEEELRQFRARDLNQEEKTEISRFEDSWPVYKQEVGLLIEEVKKGNTDYAIKNQAPTAKVVVARNTIVTASDKLTEINVRAADLLNKQAQTTFANASRLSLFLGIIGLILAVGIGLVLTGSINQPLAKGVAMMQELAKGHLSNRLRMERKDEIGTLAQEMDRFADDLQQNVVGTLKKIADGDLTTDLTFKDAGDEIRPALKQLSENLQIIIQGIGLISENMRNGNLSYRGESSRFNGDWKKFTNAVDTLIDDLVTPMTLASGFIAKVAVGADMEKITKEYKGDFNTLKENINACVDSLYSLVGETTRLAQAGVEGRLDTRADASNYKGSWGTILKGNERHTRCRHRSRERGHAGHGRH